MPLQLCWIQNSKYNYYLITILYFLILFFNFILLINLWITQIPKHTPTEFLYVIKMDKIHIRFWRKLRFLITELDKYFQLFNAHFLCLLKQIWVIFLFFFIDGREKKITEQDGNVFRKCWEFSCKKKNHFITNSNPYAPIRLICFYWNYWKP